MLRAIELEALSGTHLTTESVDRWHPDTERQTGQLALARGRFAEALAAFEEAGAREPLGLWEYGVAFALDGLGRESEATPALERAIARTDLHEQVSGALRDLALLERSHPSPQRVDSLRRRIDRGQRDFDETRTRMW